MLLVYFYDFINSQLIDNMNCFTAQIFAFIVPGSDSHAASCRCAKTFHFGCAESYGSYLPAHAFQDMIVRAVDLKINRIGIADTAGQLQGKSIRPADSAATE